MSSRSLDLRVFVAGALLVCGSQLLLLKAQQAALPDRPQLILKTGHSSMINAVTFSPDGALVATAGTDNRILVWESATGKLRWVLYGHKAPISALSIAPLNDVLAAGDDNGTLLLWNLVTGRKISTVISSEHSRITALSISPNGLWMAIGNARQIRLYNLKAGGGMRALTVPICQSLIPLVKRMPAGMDIPPCDVEKLVFSTDSSLLGSAHILGTVNVFDVKSGSNLLSRLVPAAVYSSGATSSSGAEIIFDSNNHLFSAGNHFSSFSVWDVTEGKQVFEVRGYHAVAAAFSRNGEQLAASNTPVLDHIRIWALPSFTEHEAIDSPEFLRLPLAGGPDKRLLAAGRRDGLGILQTEPKSVLATQSGPISPVISVAFSLDQKLLATEGTDSTLRVWDLIQGQLAYSFQTEFMTHAAFSADGQWVAYFNRKEKLTLYQLKTRTQIQTRFSHPSMVTPRIAISPNGGWVAWNTPQLKLWQIGTVMKPLVVCPEAGVFSFSSDGKRIAALCRDPERNTKYLGVWDVNSAKEVQPSLLWKSEEPGSLAMSRHSVGLAIADKIVLWDLTKKRMTPLIRAKPGEIFTSFAFFGPGDQFIVTGVLDRDLNNVKVWDAGKGTLIRSLRGHTSGVGAVAGSKDGRWVASGGDDGTTRIWNPRTGSEICLLISLEPFDENSDQWMVLTKKGFFDGNADAMKWIAWLEPRSTKQYPLDGFFESFYSPGLLSDAFARALPVRNFGIADKLRIPAFRSMFEQRFVTLQPRGDRVFLCMAETPDTDVLKGIELKSDEQNIPLAPKNFIRNNNSPECAYEFELPYSIKDLEIAARTSSPHRAVVTRWDDTRAERIEHSTLYVQTVGIDKYPDASGFGTLHYAKADAKAIEDYFCAHAGSIYDKVVIRDGLYNERANRKEIRHALAELAEVAKEDDVVVLFFSGHGAVPQGQEMFYFIPADIAAKSPDSERDSGLNVAMIADALRNIRARRVILIIDACQAGGVLDSLASVAEVKLAIEDRVARRFLGKNHGAGPSGVYVLAAATPFRQAIGYSSFGHGLLTEAVLEVLGGSDSPEGNSGDGQLISARDLKNRLSLAMKRLGTLVSYRQPPATFSLGADIPIAIIAHPRQMSTESYETELGRSLAKPH